MDYSVFRAKNFQLQQGPALDLELAYKTQGSLNTTKDNVILVLTSYAAQHDEAEQLVGPSDILDLTSYYIVFIDMLCNGLSSSPSNTPAPYDGPRFPAVTINDNVRCQHDLLQHLGISRLQLVMGYSMGGLQAYEWASYYPDAVAAVLPICGAARVAPHNFLFLDGAKAGLCADQTYAGGDYDAPPTAGLCAFSRVYAGWMFSQTFFRDRLYQAMGMNSIEDVVGMAQGYFMRRDANDLLGMLWTWQHADISHNERYNDDFESALNAISARVIIMPCDTDLYFTVADSKSELLHLKYAELRPIASHLGHVAGSGGVPAGKLAIDKAIMELLG